MWKEYRCPECGKMIVSPVYRQHLAWHKSAKSCAVCGKTVYGSRKFCSRRCSSKGNNNRKGTGLGFPSCVVCGKRVGKVRAKFCSIECSAERRWRRTKEKIQREGRVSTRTNTRTARKYLTETSGVRCEICGRTRWDGHEIPLVLDHIDGNPTNDVLTNLRMICGNCNMLLPTFGGGNKGSGRVWRRKNQGG